MARAKRFSINCFWRLAESVTCNKMPVWGQTSSQNQFEFVTSIKSNTNHSHLKFKFWNCICLDKMSPDEENKRLSVRLKKKKKERKMKKRKEGEKRLFFSYLSSSTLLILLALVAGGLWTPGGLILFLMQGQAWSQSRCSATCSALCHLSCRYVRQSWLVPGRESRNSLLGCSCRVGRIGCLCWYILSLQKLQLVVIIEKEEKNQGR